MRSVICSLALVSLGLATPAAACSLVGPEVLLVDTSLEDVQPPEAPEITAIEITRGRGPQPAGPGRSVSTSCDDLGIVSLSITQPDGGPDPDGDVGYLLELAEGTLADGMSLPTEPWLGPILTLSWIDGATDDQEPFDALLAITPIDRAGNLGPTVTVELADDGVAAGTGCRTTPAVPTGQLLVLASLGLLGRRRSRRGHRIS